ncbi:hypothetical protein [Orbus mooreae]|uniref:hypothetical protein n=1 Tax=Orbus mooreae TaxID=3074107 RepID=UPI00370D2ADA
MMKKKRNKKYNPSVKFQQLSKAVSPRYKIAFIQGASRYVIPIYDNKIIDKWSQTEARMLAEVRYKWSVCVGALCRDHNKKLYIKSQEFSIDIECLSHEIESILKSQQDELFESVNKNQFLTGFWIASPIPNYEFTEDELWLVANYRNVANELMTQYEYERSKQDEQI